MITTHPFIVKGCFGVFDGGSVGENGRQGVAETVICAPVAMIQFELCRNVKLSFGLAYIHIYALSYPPCAVLWSQQL